MFLLVLLPLSLIFVSTAFAAGPGDLDATFDTDGRVTTHFGYSDVAQSVAIQSDGKRVAGGTAYSSASDGVFALARYNADGSLDLSFSGDGVATTTFGGTRDSIWSVSVYKSGPNLGKILAVGDTMGPGFHRFALARYNSNGTLDTSFDTDSKVTTEFGVGGDISPLAQAFSAAIQSDGKIVAAGAFFKFNSSTGWDFALARYNPDGSLDTSFDVDGKVVTNVGAFQFGPGDAAESVAIQTNGKIVVAGHANPVSQNSVDFAVVRYNTDGSLDTSFDTDGKVTTDFGTALDIGYEMAIQSDGMIVVAGQSGDFPSADFALARYTVTGALDTSFDADGKVTTNFGGWDLGQSVAIHSDGMIVAGGHTNFGGNDLDFAVSRYNPDGSLDNSFDTDGKVTTDFGGGPDAGHSVLIQGDGRIVLAGSGGTSAVTGFAVARYGEAQEPDPSVPSVGEWGLLALAGGMAVAVVAVGARRRRAGQAA